MSYKDSKEDFVTVFNSLDGNLHDHFLLQIAYLYGGEARPVIVRFAQVHRQLPGTDQCGPMVCSYMAEILRGQSPANTVFCDDKAQRQWLHTLLESEKFMPCPRRRGRTSSDGLTDRKADIVISVDQSVAIRNRLGSMPNRPIHGWKG